MPSTIRFCRGCGVRVTGVYPVFTCPACRSTMVDAPVGVVLVVVYNAGGQIVMTRQPHWPAEFWGLVAGYVEDGETAERAAIREVKEETGLDVEVQQFLGTLIDPRIPGRLMIAFSARVTGGELRPGDDVSEARFFDPQLAPIPRGWPAEAAVERFLNYRSFALPGGSG